MSSGSGENGQTDGTGRLLAGRYRVTAQLGRGGMGVVWRAVDEVLGREVAVKELRTYNDADGPELAGLRVRMKREARAAARVRHPGVVAVHDVTEIDGRPVIVMELVDGPSLDSVLRDRGTLEPREAAGIGAKVMDALAAAHRAGVLHRDVKPGNILLDRSGRVVLTDFGIATMEDPGDDAATHLTRSGQLVGSLDYLAPERAQGADFGPASDVWALGATLYAAVEGSSPFRRTSTFSTLTAIVTEPLPDARRAGPLGPVLQRLLDKRPEGRPEAEEARELLRAVAESSGTDVPTTALRGPGDGVPARAEQEREAGPVPPGIGPVTPDPTGAPGLGAPRTPGSGAPQQGTAGPQPPEARDAGTPGQGATGQGASTAQGFDAPGQGVPGPQGFPVPGQGTPGQAASGYGTPAQGVPGPQGFPAPGHGMPGQDTPGRAASGYGTPAQGVPGPQGFPAPGHGMPGQGAPGQGASGYGTPAQGAPGPQVFSTPGHGTPVHGTPGQGTPGYGAPGQAAPGLGTPGLQDPTVHEQGYGAPGQVGRPGPGFGSSAPVPHNQAATGPMTTPGPDRRKGRALLAAVAVTVVLASAGVTVALLSGNGDPETEARPAPSGVAAHVSGPASVTPDADRSDKPKPTGKGDDKTPAATRTPSRDPESTHTGGAATPTPTKASGSGGTSGGGSGGGGTTGGAGTTGGGGGSTPAPACSAIGGGKYNCQVWKTAKSYTASGAEAGILNAGTNYFYCQQNLGRRETDGEWTNVWWAKTDDDSGNTGVFVSDVYIKGGDNDEPVPGLPVC